MKNRKEASMQITRIELQKIVEKALEDDKKDLQDIENVSANNLVVNCKTKDESEKLIQFLKKCGFCWRSGNELNSNRNYWEIYFDKTCYYICQGKYVTYGNYNSNAISFAEFYIKYVLSEMNTLTLQEKTTFAKKINEDKTALANLPPKTYVVEKNKDSNQITLEDALRTLSDTLYSKIKECEHSNSKKKQGMYEAYIDSYQMFADLLKNPVEFTKQKRTELGQKNLKVRDVVVKKGIDNPILVTQVNPQWNCGVYLDTGKPVIIDSEYTKMGHMEIKETKNMHNGEQEDEVGIEKDMEDDLFGLYI